MDHADRIKDTTTSTGTGNITVSGTPPVRHRALSTLTVGTQYPILIEGRDASTEWELAECTILTGTTFSRNAVIKSSNSDDFVSFSAGTKDVVVTLSADHINKLPAVDDVAFSQTIPLSTGGTRYMPQTTVTGALTFVASASLVRGSLVYLPLIADGTHAPDFSAFEEWGGSLGWDNTAGITNQVQFFHDGYASYVSISQVVGAVPETDATGVTMSGPSSGVVSVASTNFTIGVSPSGGTITGTVVVTPSSGGGGGTFTPTTVSLTDAIPTATFTYTPASTGAKTISVTNNGGLTNPSNITYTVSASDTTAPTVSSAVVENAAPTQIIITFNETLAAFTPATSAFTVSGGKTVSGVSRSGATVTVTVNTAYANGDTITFGYTKPGTNQLRDAAGNEVATFSGQAVTNNIASSASYARLTSLQLATETGTGPYTYTAGGSSHVNQQDGGLLNKKFGSGANGEFIFKVSNASGPFKMGVSGTATRIHHSSFAFMVSNLYGAGYGWDISSESGQTANITNAGSVNVANNQYLRVKKAGSTYTIHVSTDLSSWTLLSTIINQSTGDLFVQWTCQSGSVISELQYTGMT
jgi:hypothetical protein